MAQQQKSVRIDSLPSEQLDHLGKQLDRELSRLQQSASMLATLANEYSVSESAVQELKSLSDDQEMMVPLTESLYVSGHVHDKDHLLVEIGAGYYAEKSPDEAAKFCQRRVTHVRKQLDELGEEIQSKQNAIMQINQVMGQRQRAAQANEAAAQV